MSGVLYDDTITLAPGESVALSLFNDASAFAVSAVPVPAALPLLGSALLLGAPLARRRGLNTARGPAATRRRGTAGAARPSSSGG